MAGVFALTGCAAATTAGSGAPAVTVSPASSSTGSPSSVPSPSGPGTTTSTRPTVTTPATTSAERPSSVPSAATGSSAQEAPGTSVVTDGSKFGEILFDGTGQAIYLFDLETTTEPACYDDCATAWPPVLTDGAPVAGGSVRADALGTTTRSDGGVQVTYNGHPLYFYADEGKNEVTCHDVVEFGGRWLVVTPSGDAADH